MLAAAILLFVVLLGVLFLLDFGTDLKPGVMTKVKTLLMHFQVDLIFIALWLVFPVGPDNLETLQAD